jgi:hypothetical protein
VVLGEETAEYWTAAGDADAPLVFAQKMDVGCLSRDSVQIADGKLYWLSNHRSIVENGQRVSTASIDEKLRLADDQAEAVTSFPVKRDGHWMVGFNVPGQGTYVFGIAGRGWVQWASDGLGPFRACCGVVSDGEPYLGDRANGTVWKFGTAQQLDGSARITQQVSAFLDSPGPPMRVPPITYRAVMGQGAHTDPEIELRVSRNRGRTFEDWQRASLGQEGEYDLQATFRRQGMVDSRGLVLEFRHSENIISAALEVVLEARP